MEELLERVKAATGPDRELDVLIGGLTGYRNRFTGRLLSDALADPVTREEAFGWEGVPNYTSSVDAALALVERMLPGAEYEITTLYNIAAVTLPLNMDNYCSERREDSNVPLAILQALLRVLAFTPAPA